MLTDHTKSEMKPLGINNIFKPSPGLDGDGFGLGFRIRGSGSGSLLFGSVGEFGWAGAAETMFFVDPIEEFYVVFMAQNLDQPGASALFKQMVYSALI
jgi:CubicO group peptidase (beta-lactamase class C family)